MKKVFIASYRRTPFVKFAGVFQNFSAVQLGSFAATAAIKDSRLSPERIDYIVVGQVLQGLAGQNPSRQTAIASGLNWDTPGTAINSVCLSGMEAVSQGARLISSGEREAVLVVGQESMSQAPHAARLRLGAKYGALELVDSLEYDGLTDAFAKTSMGLLTDQENKRLAISRAEQDFWAVKSHQLADKHSDFLAQEIVEVSTSKFGLVASDNGVRPDATIETMSGLRPAFSADGTITAGNSSQITDGAAAIVLVNEDLAKELKLDVLAEVISYAQVAGPTTTLQSQPSHAILAALSKTSIKLNNLESIEINEAFAAVIAQSVKDLKVEEAIVNPHSGAIALGHPIGASGTRIVGHLARSLRSLGSGKAGAAGICGGGGQGSAIILRSV